MCVNLTLALVTQSDLETSRFRETMELESELVIFVTNNARLDYSYTRLSLSRATSCIVLMIIPDESEKDDLSVMINNLRHTGTIIIQISCKDPQLKNFSFIKVTVSILVIRYEQKVDDRVGATELIIKL